MSRYWKANKATSRKIQDLLKQDREMVNKACELSKRLGANPTQVCTYETMGTLRLAGLIFADGKADTKKFKPLPNHKNGWAPRRLPSKEGRALCKEFDALRSYAYSRVMQLVGMVAFDGAKWYRIGVLMVKGTAYLATNDKTSQLKGCKRISDLEYERILRSFKEPVPRRRKQATKVK